MSAYRAILIGQSKLKISVQLHGASGAYIRFDGADEVSRSSLLGCDGVNFKSENIID